MSKFKSGTVKLRTSRLEFDTCVISTRDWNLFIPFRNYLASSKCHKIMTGLLNTYRVLVPKSCCHPDNALIMIPFKNC